MNKLAAFIFSMTIVATAGTAGLAMSHMNGGAMMMPKCSAGDPAVTVNMKNKMYMMGDKMHTGMSDSMGTHMGAKSNMMHKDKMMSNMRMMCKSKADAMGAHMVKGSMMKKNSM